MQLGTKLISSKRGMMVVAAAAALLAGVLILIYLNGYRNSVKAEGAPVTVLIAQENIAVCQADDQRIHGLRIRRSLPFRVAHRARPSPPMVSSRPRRCVRANSAKVPSATRQT